VKQIRGDVASMFSNQVNNREKEERAWPIRRGSLTAKPHGFR